MATKVEQFQSDCLADLSFFAENPVAPLYIAPESGPIARVELRRVQKRLAEVVNRQWFMKGCLRVILCKARRIGATTFFCMDAYRQASLKQNTNVVIGAQLDDMAERIHERNHIFHANYPPALRPSRHGKSRSFKEPMEFRRDVPEAELAAWEAGGPKPDMGLNSSISIFTERTPLARTGATIQYLLLSEFAKYRNQGTIIKEMFPTVRRGTGAIVIDTTAEGRGDSYSRLWEEAVAGRSEFEPVFISWLDDDQQCHQDPTQENVDNFHPWLECVRRDDLAGIRKYSSRLNLDEEEHELLRDHVMPRWNAMTEEERSLLHPMGFVEWRRWAIRDRCDGRVSVFKNQYPTHWREAFLSSSITIFDMAQIGFQHDRIIEEKEMAVRGEMIETGGRNGMEVDPDAMMAQVDRRLMTVRSSMFSFSESAHGPVHVYEPPQPDAEYIIASDYAEGLSDNCDYNVIHVYKRGDSLEQVAWFHEKCYPEECASEAIALGAWYNMAWQIPEVNSCGAAALALMRTCYPVDRIYRRRAPDNAKTLTPSSLLGWKMTGRSKAEAVGNATTMFKQGRVILRSERTLRELGAFVKKSKRMLPEAMDGTDPVTGEPYHDDEVVVMVLAIHASRQLPWRGTPVQSARKAEILNCQHIEVADCVCVKCGERFPELAETKMTFDSLRKMVKDSTEEKRRRNEFLPF
tara:strand:- start:3649 stop:5718 length:2070 start_codon:yes stop_codon:yes gene_type:complete